VSLTATHINLLNDPPLLKRCARAVSPVERALYFGAATSTSTSAPSSSSSSAAAGNTSIYNKPAGEWAPLGSVQNTPAFQPTAAATTTSSSSNQLDSKHSHSRQHTPQMSPQRDSLSGASFAAANTHSPSTRSFLVGAAGTTSRSVGAGAGGAGGSGDAAAAVAHAISSGEWWMDEAMGSAPAFAPLPAAGSSSAAGAEWQVAGGSGSAADQFSQKIEFAMCLVLRNTLGYQRLITQALFDDE
jgi:hypothetical protein